MEDLTEQFAEEHININVPPAQAIAVCYYDKPDISRQEEFLLLIKSAEVISSHLVEGRLNRNDVSLFLTKGRLAKLLELITATEAKEVFIDAELSGIQLRNLTRELKVLVTDRSSLILKIFALRARSQAGKMQVQLARLQYNATHLVREWSHLERQRGGLSKTGGPGEKQIELDRRMIDEKIKKLKKDLLILSKQRDSQRKSRQRSGAFTIALVGYTNTGKSTLFNTLTKANSLAKDQLFASLDPMARRCYIPDLPPQQNIIALDTVGFVRNLPHNLVEAFHATLEETRLADLLLIVGDISDSEANLRYRDVEKVLEEINVADTPRILVWNKVDLLTNPPTPINKSLEEYSKYEDKTEIVFISAREKIGIDELQKLIAKKIDLKLSH